MTSTYILILATLILGGLIALLGDRLGTKVGKARLRLFKLRPRQTATVITIVVGTLISASTLGVLLLLSESLRKGLFELERIQKDKRAAEAALNGAVAEKEKIAEELSQVRAEQDRARNQLLQTRRDFDRSTKRLETISGQAQGLQQELDALLEERSKQVQQLEGLKEQSQYLQQELDQREAKINNQDAVISTKENSIQDLRQKQAVLQSEIGKRDTSIADLDRQISAKDREIGQRTQRLGELETQLKFLQREVAILEQYYQNYQELRERRIAVVKGEVLASATIRVVDRKAVVPAIDRLLAQANRNAIKSILLDDRKFADTRVVRITNSQVEQLAEQIVDGKDYVVRILSAGNYVQGEQEISVFADIAVNKEVFQAGEAIATVSIDSEQMDQLEIQERLDWLLAASKFRAQRAGIIGNLQIGDGQIATIINFIEDIGQSEEPLGEIKAVVAETTFTAGPLKLNLVVVKNGVVVLST